MSRRILSGLFGLLAAGIAALTVVLTVLFLHAEPMVLKVPPAAVEAADSFMAAVCDGNYEKAQELLQGNPDLGADQVPEDAAGKRIWEAFLDSMDYRLSGECYAVDSGLAQDVQFLCLDMDSVTGTLGDRARKLLEQKVAQAQDMTEIYDEDNNYRQELVNEVLLTVTEAAIREDAAYVEQTITLKLTCQGGKWYVVPEQNLLNVLFGGIA